MDFHGNINLRQNQMQRMVVQSEDNFPVTPIVGRVVFKGAKLYMCVAINNLIPVWLPLTNKIDTYVHTEAVAATTWTITHNLNTTVPLLQIYNAAGEMLIPDSVTPTSNNIMEVTFNTAIAGTAIVLFGDLMPQSGIGLLEPGIPTWIVDVSLATYDNKSLLVTSQTLGPKGIVFNQDGTSLFMFGSSAVFRYGLTAAYDISTASYSGETSGLLDAPTGGVFSPSGNKLIITGSDGLARLFEYDLIDGYDVTTLVDNNIHLNIWGTENSPKGLVFNDDGTKLFVIGDQNNLVYQYNLPNAYELAGASYSGITYNVSSEILTPTGIAFNNDGTLMYISEASGVFQYILSSAWDITTASYANKSFDGTTQDTNSKDVHFLPEDGTKMYLTGETTDTIYQYSTNI